MVGVGVGVKVEVGVQVEVGIGIRVVELGKFDPPLWHAPYGRIV